MRLPDPVRSTLRRNRDVVARDVDPSGVKAGQPRDLVAAEPSAAVERERQRDRPVAAREALADEVGRSLLACRADSCYLVRLKGASETLELKVAYWFCFNLLVNRGVDPWPN